MRKQKRIKIFILPIFIAFIFCALCNFTTQSYNTGKLLNPGETLAGIGVGKREYYSIKRRDTLKNNSQSFSYDTVRSKDLSLCLDYRLGVLRTCPLGKGIEIGFHLEGPNQFNPDTTVSSVGEFKGPAVLEFDSRFGLNDLCLGKGLYHHNFSLGWTIGSWIDNGWFVEYAAGWEYKWLIPYTNIRAELLPTDPSGDDSLTESYTPFKYEKRSWTTRTATGVSIRLPHTFSVRFPYIIFLPLPRFIVIHLPHIIPDFLCPEISVIYPHYSAISHYGITYHIAFRWLNGI